MAIRTFWVEDGQLHFGTGGGITWDSDPDDEWAETELKARNLLRVASGSRRMSTELVWVNGSLVDAAEATVSIFDHGLTVGDGVFETLKAVDGQPFAARRHLDRLRRSADGLDLRVPFDDDELRDRDGRGARLARPAPRPGAGHRHRRARPRSAPSAARTPPP